MTLTIARRAAAQQQVLRRPNAPTTTRRFSVWGPADFNASHTSIEQVLLKASSLVVGSGWTEVEFLVKAGEGGSWQRSLSGHPLHIAGPASLQRWIDVGQQLGVRVTPYVVVRGRGSRWPTEDWRGPEQAQIRECVRVARRCVLNVEPGSHYWNGPHDPTGIRAYLRGIGVDPSALEVCLIPRQNQTDELGGAACIQAWTDPALVGSASWECYGLTAGIPGPTSLLVDEAIPRLDGWGVPPDPRYRIPVVQRDERTRWAQTEWCAAGMQLWYLDGN